LDPQTARNTNYGTSWEEDTETEDEEPGIRLRNFSFVNVALLGSSNLSLAAKPTAPDHTTGS
jgi:hypothetical protein